MKSSKYQEAIYDWVKNGSGNIQVEAVAGSGKTTTIVNALKYINPMERVLFLAFNRAIATELHARVPENVQAKTFNSFGFQIVRSNGRCRVNPNKTKNILKSQIEWSDYIKLQNIVPKIISLMKSDAGNFREIIEHHDITLPTDYEDYIKTIINNVWHKSLRMISEIDFDDQIFFPVKFNMSFPTYDWVFVDEAQDLNQVQIALLKKINGSPRICAVGDTRQSIYGFRGACNAIPRLVAELEMEKLPLSICYRCPKAIVQEAQKIVPEIEFFKEGGEVKTVTDFDPQEGDYTLCRTTQPLVSKCLSMIREGKTAHVKGRAIGENLKELAKLFRGEDFLDNLEDFRQKFNDKNRSREERLIEMNDKLDTLVAIYDFDDNVISAIDQIFTDNSDGIMFSTIHRAKGLEANNIFILKPELLPHPNAKKDWMKIQEMNLKYVAITRAMKTLTYVLS